MKIHYPCTVAQLGDGKYYVSFFDFEEANTKGETFEEALLKAEEMLTLALESRLQKGEMIPLPRYPTYPGTRFISPSVRVQSALLVKFSRGEQTLADLAKTLETSWTAVSRLEDPSHWATLKHLSKIATALGQRLVLSFEKHE